MMSDSHSNAPHPSSAHEPVETTASDSVNRAAEPAAGVSLDAVWERLATEVRPGPMQRVPISVAAGMVLAEDVRAAFDYPPFDRAVMDGYAVQCADFRSESATLTCIGLARAGQAQRQTVYPGTCIQINTGAAVPPGADAVVIVEKTRDVGGGRVQLNDSPRQGQNVAHCGDLARAGDLIVRAGTRIQPGTIAAIVSAGAGEVQVFRAPRVAVLTTGDELAGIGAERGGDQIPDSNGLLLKQLVDGAGGKPVLLGRCVDEPSALRAALEAALRYDVLCVAGGMSQGTHDLAPAMLESLGVRWLATSVDMKPGKPTHIGRAATGAWVLGLPGNPVSCAVCFLLFGRSILGGLAGQPVRRPAHLSATLGAEAPANGARPMYQPAEWGGAGGRVVVTPIDWRGSGDPFGMAVANALLFRPANAPVALRGDTASFLPVGEAA